MSQKPSPSLEELGFGEVPAIDLLYACAEAAKCSADDIVKRRLNGYQVDAVKRKLREIAAEDPDADPDICGMPG
jgi:hypothetical protein